MEKSNKSALPDEVDGSTESSVQNGRRDALAKLAYTAPVVATVVMSRTASAQQGGSDPFKPPAPPSG